MRGVAFRVADLRERPLVASAILASVATAAVVWAAVPRTEDGAGLALGSGRLVKHTYVAVPAQGAVSEGAAQSKLMVSEPATAVRAAGFGRPSGADRASAAARRRAIAKSASLDLLVPDVARAIDAVRAIAAANASDVDGLDDRHPASGAGAPGAEMTLAVPADRLDAVLARLAVIGGIRARSVSADDVGDQIVDDRARLRNLRRTETDLLRIMDRSGRTAEILAVEEQLSSVRDDIERLDAERATLETRVSYAHVQLTLESIATVPSAEPTAAQQLGNAWHDALRELGAFTLALVGRALVVAAFAPYWLAFAVAFALVLSRLRRRRVRPA